MSSKQRLTPESFDGMTRRRDRLWGLNSIARHMACSVDKARRIARLPDSPIYKPEENGTYFAFGGELDQWLRSKK